MLILRENLGIVSEVLLCRLAEACVTRACLSFVGAQAPVRFLLKVKCTVIVHFGLPGNVIHLSSTSQSSCGAHGSSERVRVWERRGGFVAAVIDYCTPVSVT